MTLYTVNARTRSRHEDCRRFFTGSLWVTIATLVVIGLEGLR